MKKERVPETSETLVFVVGVHCAKTLWDEARNLPKRKHPYYTEILILIEQKKSWATKTLLGLEADESGYSAEEVKTTWSVTEGPERPWCLSFSKS